MKNHKFSPESLMMSYGYKPELSQGAIKCPIFNTSTFVFKTAQEGKAFFEVAYGLREKAPSEEMGLIYSRINNPNLEILENRLCLWDKADDCAVFESGMSAITTVLLEFLKPGDLLVYSNPTYGGTDHFINHYLPSIGVTVLGVHPNQSKDEIVELIENSGKASNLKMIYLETPANPTNDLLDIEMYSEIAKHFSTAQNKVITAVDNTFMGPIWQHPLRFGADLVLYSATKYIGGHSDLIAGAVLGSNELMIRVKTLRTFLGNMASSNTAWLLMRSLETLKIRMDKQSQNAEEVAHFLKSHDKVESVNFLGLLVESSHQYDIYKRQCTAPGAMITFNIKGGEKQAFQLLNHLKLVKLAVSLGGTESLAQHPITMTHAGVDPESRKRMNITDKMVRLSIGVEDAKDIIWDLNQAFEKVELSNMEKLLKH
ncbi:cystathionine gamma-synthase family protein [Urechidicola croceus]|uniref:Methionine gamma-lyase n=1 Tax=Urechidicola croceus TaxID=1850246 RepID=A0A1D8P4D3_9FLAO|nr:cystathionine gamma-synthase family protein [Urechidicola croceus]AOW19425.1 methionine gamma-lyase [Urechidicola croceus]